VAGNAVDLTAWVIQTAANQEVNEEMEDRLRTVAHTDWNLDSDRGYGYKVRRADHLPSDVNDNDGVVDNERLIDESGAVDQGALEVALEPLFSAILARATVLTDSPDSSVILYDEASGGLYLAEATGDNREPVLESRGRANSACP